MYYYSVDFGHIKFQSFKAQAWNFRIIYMFTFQIFITIKIYTTNDLMSLNGIDVHVGMIKTHIDSIDSI